MREMIEKKKIKGQPSIPASSKLFSKPKLLQLPAISITNLYI
jgi:hypothetical protein